MCLRTKKQKLLMNISFKANYNLPKVCAEHSFFIFWLQRGEEKVLLGGWGATTVQFFSYIICINLTDCEFTHIFGSWALSKKTNNHRLHTNLGSIYEHCVYSVSNVTDWLDISCNILITICTVLKVKPTVYFHL